MLKLLALLLIGLAALAAAAPTDDHSDAHIHDLHVQMRLRHPHGSEARAENRMMEPAANHEAILYKADPDNKHSLAFGDEVARTTSDDNGFVSFEDIEPGEYILYCHHGTQRTVDRLSTLNRPAWRDRGRRYAERARRYMVPYDWDKGAYLTTSSPDDLLNMASPYGVVADMFFNPHIGGVCYNHWNLLFYSPNSGFSAQHSGYSTGDYCNDPGTSPTACGGMYINMPCTNGDQGFVEAAVWNVDMNNTVTYKIAFWQHGHSQWEWDTQMLEGVVFKLWKYCTLYTNQSATSACPLGGGWTPVETVWLHDLPVYGDDNIFAHLWQVTILGYDPWDPNTWIASSTNDGNHLTAWQGATHGYSRVRCSPKHTTTRKALVPGETCADRAGCTNPPGNC